MTGWHWRTSCFCNRLLLGRAGQPVCARVYAAKPSIGRSVFLFVMDLAFGDFEHCKSIHRRWQVGRGSD